MRTIELQKPLGDRHIKSWSVAAGSLHGRWRSVLNAVISLGILVSMAWCAKRDIATRRHAADTYAEIDAQMTALPADNGLFIEFRGFNTPQPQSDNPNLRIYYRMIYLLYPRPLYVSDLSGDIRDAADLTPATNASNDDWLRQHDVGGVVRLQLINTTPTIVSWRPVKQIPTSGRQ